MTTPTTPTTTRIHHAEPLSQLNTPLVLAPGDSANYFQSSSYQASTEPDHEPAFVGTIYRHATDNRLLLTINPPYAHTTPQSEPDRYIWHNTNRRSLYMANAVLLRRCEFARRLLSNSSTLDVIARRRDMASI